MRFIIKAHVLWNRHVYIRSQQSGTEVPVCVIDSMNKYIKGPYSTLSSSLKRGAYSIRCILWDEPIEYRPFYGLKRLEGDSPMQSIKYFRNFYFNDNRSSILSSN